MLTFRRPLHATLASAALFVVVSQSAGAQFSCVPVSRALETVGVETPEVLSRKVSLQERAISLRDALDRLATAGRLRISYSPEALHLSRAVCLDYTSATVARILGDLLDGSAVKPVVVGADQIVLTPTDPRTGVSMPPPAAKLMRQVEQLDRVVVTGSALGASQRSIPVALDIISDKQVSQRGTGSLSDVLDGVVPGMWIWEQSPLSLLARYGSIRGASSFGVSYPKVYVDGIEAANSLLVTHLDPEAISRIEIIRGPQGAALYGADAISGVMNIVTRQDATDGGAARGELLTRGGASSSDYATGSVLSQTHAASLRAGDRTRSARLGATMTRIGAFVPDAFSRQITTNGGVRFVGSRGVINGSFRVFAQDAQVPANPLIAEIGQSAAALPTLNGSDSSGRQSVRQFTLGGAATYTQSDRWTHSATVGIDGYRLSSTTVPGGAFPSATDSALLAARGSAIRSTLRLTSTGNIGRPEAISGTLTLAAEHSFIRDRTLTESGFIYPGSANGSDSRWLAETRSNTGLVAQMGAGFRDMLHLTGGVRMERNTGLDGIGEIATLPMIGISAVHSIGANTLKLRSAYGRGIRAPETSARARLLLTERSVAPGSPLSPEEQSGIEVGADLFLGRSIALQVTRFDQTASGLIQPVSTSRGMTEVAPVHQYISYELQNVGVITNRGWELQGRLTSGPWAAGATFSQVDSRVRRLAAYYTGDLRPGDRMLEVPARTLGINAGYERGRWSTSWNLSRASDWINYDRLAMLESFSSEERNLGDFVGPELRSWWRAYEGVTRLGGRIAVAATRGMILTFDADNLLDEQRGEPDNVTVVPGRTLSAGLRLSF